MTPAEGPPRPSRGLEASEGRTEAAAAAESGSGKRDEAWSLFSVADSFTCLGEQTSSTSELRSQIL